MHRYVKSGYRRWQEVTSCRGPRSATRSRSTEKRCRIYSTVWRDRSSTADRLDSKSFFQRIAIVDDEGVLAGDPGRAFDLGDDRLVLADERARADAAGEARADEALVDERFVVGEQAHRVDDRHHRARAGAARRSVDFGVGEDRDVAKIGALVARRAGEDRAVDAAQARLERMRDRRGRFDGVLDLHTGAPQIREMSGIDWQADCLAVHDGVEGAAERDVRANHPRRQLDHESAAPRRPPRPPATPTNAT